MKAPTLPELPDWPAPDQRAEVWPRPLSRHQRQAAAYRASKNRDRPIPKSWRRERERVELTNGRVLVLDLVVVSAYVLPRPLSWVEHDLQHEAMFGGVNPWAGFGTNDPRTYILNESWWPGVLGCRCGAYVLDDKPDDVRSFLWHNRQARAAALAVDVERERGHVVKLPTAYRG